MTTGTPVADKASRVEPRSKTRSRRSVPARIRSLAKDWLDRPMTSWHLILALFGLLLCFGLLMVLSASSISSFRSAGADAFAGFKKQAMYAAVGLIIFVVAARVSPRLLRMAALWSVLVSLLLLAAVLVIGTKKYGARCWIEIGPISFQPSEVAKLALAIWMAHKLAAGRNSVKTLRQLAPMVLAFALMAGLIMLEPDLGTLVSLALVFFAALWFGGAPLWLFGFLIAAGAGGIGYLSISAPYRLARVRALLDPNNPAYAADTYQLRQGLYGMGNGGLFGAGLGQSKVKWSWLPNADSDFIFAVIGEELGFFAGSLVILLLFGLLAYTGMRISRRNVDPFIKILSATCTVWLVGQAAINIGYVVGLLPVTGITLPMISTGGTSLIVTMGVFGLLANFARREPQAAAALYSEGPGRLARFLGIRMAAPGASSDTGWAAKRRARRAAAAAKRAERVRRERAEQRAAAERRPPRPGGRGEPRRSTGRPGPAAEPGRPERAGRRPDRVRDSSGGSVPDRRADGAARRMPTAGPDPRNRRGPAGSPVRRSAR